MKERRRLYFLIVIMIAVVSATAGILSFTLYRVSFEQQRARLIEIVQIQARLIEATARFNAGYSENDENLGGAFESTLGQIRNAHKSFRGLGETGEFTLAKLEGDRIVFLLSQRPLGMENPGPVPFSSQLAEPMRRALSGKSGSVTGLDYRGVMVLAAYEPLDVLDLGIVAKIDLAEIRAPFINAGSLAGGVGLMFILLGAALFLNIGNSLIRHLEENERKYRTLSEGATDGLYLMTDVFEECNEQACRLLGCRYEDIIGHLPVQFSPPTQPDGRDSAEAAKERIEAALSGTPQSFYWKCRRKDGVLIDAEISLQAIELRGRRVIMATQHDITQQKQTEEENARLAQAARLRATELELSNQELVAEIVIRKQAEEALKVSESRYEDLYDNAPDMYLNVDPTEAKILRCNQATAAATGYTKDELLGRPVFDLSHPDSLEDVKKTFRSFVETGGVHNAELEVIRKNGSKLPISSNVSALRDEQGQILQSRFIWRDITERKQAEKATALRSRIAEIFITVPDDEMYNEVLRVILEAMQSQYGAFGYIDDNGALVVPSMTRHIWDKCQVSDKSFVFPRDTWGNSSWPRSIREKRTDYSNEVSTITPEGHVEIRRHISCPILFRGEVIGLLQVANKETDYTAADVRSLESIAEQIAPFLSARLQRVRDLLGLQERENKYHTVLQTAMDGFWIVDTQGKILEVNEAYCRLSGYSRQELLLNIT